MENAFASAKAYIDVLKYEEAERLFHEIYEMQRRVNENSDGEPYRHKHGGRDLTHDEVYAKALDDVMNLIDGRLEELSA